MWQRYDLTIFIDICREYKEKLRFYKVKQVLGVGGIRALRYLLCSESMY